MKDDDGFTGKEDFKDLFTGILGSEVNIKDNINKSEEMIFNHLINILATQQSQEDELYELSGIGINKYTDPLWSVITNVLQLLYGEDKTELIMWYIIDRFNPDGTIIPVEDENGKEFIFNTPKDLWSYINHRYPKDN
tara:strand:- start:531 stop:941 length:411 start_codon:yes stop_codon:yes gene_type:complete